MHNSSKMTSKFQFSQKGIYLLKETIVFLVISLLLLVIGFTHSLIQYRILIIAASLWTIIGVCWLIDGNSAKIPFKIPVLIWLICYVLSSVGSIDPRRSFGQMLIMSASLFIFYLVFDLVNKGWHENLFAKGLIFACLFITISGLYNSLVWYQNWLATNPGVFFPAINYRPLTTNLMATFLYMSAILCSTYFFYVKSKINKLILLGNTGASLFMLYLTSSRGGWSAAAAGFGVLIFLLVWQKKINLRKIWDHLKSRPILMVIVMILVILLISILGYFLYQKALHPTHGNFLSSRQSLWEPAIETFKKHPIIGQGPFTYGSSFIASISTPPSMIYVHAHSIPMNTLAEMGILGFLALGFLVFSYGKKIINLLKQTKQAVPPIVIGTVAYATSFLVHNFFESLALEPSLLWPATILLGATVGVLSKNNAVAVVNKINRSWWIIIPIIFAWVGIWIITPFHEGVELANQNQWQAAREQLSIAIKRDPTSSIAHQQLGLVHAVLASQGEANALQNAIGELNLAVKSEPSWALNFANLSSLYYGSGDLKKAQTYAELTRQKAPRSAIYNLNLGVIAEVNNEFSIALSSYHSVLDIEPSWIKNPYWSETPIRRLAKLDKQRWQTYSENQSLDTILEKVSKNTQYAFAYNILANYYFENRDWDLLEQQLNLATMAYSNLPINSIDSKWLKAELFAIKGDYNSAVTIGEIALNNYYNFGLYGPGSFGILTYAPLVFRSPSIALELVPQFVKPLIPSEWDERKNILIEWKQKQ